MLLDGTVDAVWIYADQANNYQCDPISSSYGNNSESANWNCEMWGRFGTEFAYIQSGMNEHIVTGATLSLSKKGSGLPKILNPCLDSFKLTEAYKDICEKYNFLDQCFPNEFFPDPDNINIVKPYRLPTSELEAKGFSCSDGYCNCTE